MSPRTPVIAAGVVIAASLAVVGILQDDSSTPQAAKTTSIAAKAGPKHPAHHLPKGPNPRTPNLIGQSPQAARDMASARGLRLRFAPYRYDCEGPPTGHVVWQVGAPGGRAYKAWIEAGTSVQTTCGQLHLAAPSCAANQLSLSTNGADSAYTGTAGEISLLVLIKNRRRSPCRVDGTLQLTVVRSGSFDSSIRGNPGSLQVHWGLHGRQTLATEWLWPSWCGPRGSVDLVARFAGLTARGDSHSPICMAKNSQPYLMGANISPEGALP
jgi:hypothetical protein